MSAATHYRLLGVAETASPDDVRTAYRRRARAAHPDHAGSAADMAALNEAWRVLGDPARRAAYDRELWERRRPGRPATDTALGVPAMVSPTTSSTTIPDVDDDRTIDGRRERTAGRAATSWGCRGWWCWRCWPSSSCSRRMPRAARTPRASSGPTGSCRWATACASAPVTPPRRRRAQGEYDAVVADVVQSAPTVCRGHASRPSDRWAPSACACAPADVGASAAGWYRRNPHGRLAQLEERHVHTVEVGGSRPPSPTK